MKNELCMPTEGVEAQLFHIDCLENSAQSSCTTLGEAEIP